MDKRLKYAISEVSSLFDEMYKLTSRLNKMALRLMVLEKVLEGDGQYDDIVDMAIPGDVST